jgi:hypothetical protein
MLREANDIRIDARQSLLRRLGIAGAVLGHLQNHCARQRRSTTAARPLLRDGKDADIVIHGQPADS